MCSVFFFFNDTATTEIYTLSLHDALPIYRSPGGPVRLGDRPRPPRGGGPARGGPTGRTGGERRGVRRALRRAGRRPRFRSEEHTSELQSQSNLVCRPLLEKKNTFLKMMRW